MSSNVVSRNSILTVYRKIMKQMRSSKGHQDFATTKLLREQFQNSHKKTFHDYAFAVHFEQFSRTRKQFENLVGRYSPNYGNDEERLQRLAKVVGLQMPKSK